jgi:Rod binding domain-containing protein
MNTPPLPPSGGTSGATPPDREKIREAAKGFEGLFLAQLLKIMKNSIPGSKDNTLLKSDVMSEFADMEFARVLAERRGIGLSDMLYRSLAKTADDSSEAGKETSPLPLGHTLKAMLPLENTPVPLHQAMMPLERSKTSAKRTLISLESVKNSMKRLSLPMRGASGSLKPPRLPDPIAADLKPEALLPDEGSDSHPQSHGSQMDAAISQNAPEPPDLSTLAPQAAATGIDPLIERVALRHGLHPGLLRAVIDCESSGNPLAVSPRGAKGLMQLADSTAQMLGVRDVWDPEENVEGGARYLKSLLDRFDHKLDWALAAYNAGPTAVVRHQGVPPFDETERYVRKVLDLFGGPGKALHHGS